MAETRSPFDRPLPATPPVAPERPAPPPVAGEAARDDRAERLARLAAARKPDGAPRPRAHPSKTARTMALVSSVLATGGVAAAMAAAEGAPSPNESTAAGVIVPTDSTSSAAGSTTSAAGSTSSAAGSTSTVAGNSSRSASSTTALYADGTWSGAAEWTRWGYVQVQATVKNGKLSDVTALQSPSDGRSRSINSRAQPVLEQEAIAAQSADIDMVSGATYTSRTYSASLQAALDKAAQAVSTAKAGQS